MRLMIPKRIYKKVYFCNKIWYRQFDIYIYTCFQLLYMWNMWIVNNIGTTVTKVFSCVTSYKQGLKCGLNSLHTHNVLLINNYFVYMLYCRKALHSLYFIKFYICICLWMKFDLLAIMRCKLMCFESSFQIRRALRNNKIWF